jgi:hypothetical protein
MERKGEDRFSRVKLMRSHQRPVRNVSLRCIVVLGIASLTLLDTACGRRKDGIIVETSDTLDRAGVVVRDWRRSGMGILDVQIYSQAEIPANSWTMSAFDKAGTLLKSGSIAGPRTRVGDTIWIKLSTPYRDLFDKADRVVIGADVNLAGPKP